MFRLIVRCPQAISSMKLHTHTHTHTHIYIYIYTKVSQIKTLMCMLQAGPPSLYYYCTVVLHSCTVLPPVGHSSYHQYHCCELKRQSSCESNENLNVRVANGAVIFTLLLRRRVAFLHRTATCRPIFKLSVSLLST